jgi:cardiolipin synthase C
MTLLATKLKVSMILFICLIIIKPDTASSYVYNSQETHNIQFLNHGAHSLYKRIQLIRSARESIELETYIFRIDNSGKILLNELMAQAKKGVKVRILIDNHGAKADFTPYLSYILKTKNIEVRYFNTAPLTQINKVQNRNHRKTLIIDSNISIFGGRNVGNEYFDLHLNFNFLDRDILLTGPLNKKLKLSFEQFWKSKYSQDLSKTPPRNEDYALNFDDPFDFDADYTRALEYWEKKISLQKNAIQLNKKDKLILSQVKKLAKKVNSRQYAGNCHDLTLVSDLPLRGKKASKKAVVGPYFLKALKNVEEKFILGTPYFIFTKESRKIVTKMLGQDNIEVQLLTNSLYSTDANTISAVFNKQIKKGWLKKGLELYSFKGGQLGNYPLLESAPSQAIWGTHSKSYILDDSTFMLGSYNFDPRSQNINVEMGLFCRGSEELTSKLHENIQKRMGYSHKVTNNQELKETRYQNVRQSKLINYFLFMYPSLFIDHLL